VGGYYEVRVTGPGRRHYRLFCLLDNGTADELAQRGFSEPRIAVINGMVKHHMTEFTDAEYRKHARVEEVNGLLITLAGYQQTTTTTASSDLSNKRGVAITARN